MTRRRSQASRASGSNTTSNIEEGMSNVLAVQSLDRHKREGERFSQASAESFKRFRVRNAYQTDNRSIRKPRILDRSNHIFHRDGRIRHRWHVYRRRLFCGVCIYFFVLSAVFYSFGFLYTELQSFIAWPPASIFLVRSTHGKHGHWSRTA